MEAVIFVKLMMSMLLVVSMIILNFTIFRIPVKDNHKQLAVISLIVGGTLIYFKLFLNASGLFIPTFVYVVMLIVVRRYPFLYAFIIGVFGSLCLTIADTVVTGPALSLGLSTLHEMQSNILHYVAFHAATSFIMLLAAYIIYKINIGFWFVRRRFTGQIKKSDVVWAMILIIIIFIIQYTFLNIALISRHGIIWLLLVLGLVLLLGHAYKQNEKVKKERFGEGG